MGDFILYREGQQCPICGSTMRTYRSKKTNKSFVGCPSARDPGHGSIYDKTHPKIKQYLELKSNEDLVTIKPVDYTNIILTEEQQHAVKVIETALRVGRISIILEQVAGAGKTFIAGYIHQHFQLADNAKTHKDLKNPFYPGRKFALLAFNNINAGQARERGIPAFTYHGLVRAVVQKLYKKCNQGKNQSDINNKLRHTISHCGVLHITQSKEIKDRTVIHALVSITSYCMNMLSPYWDQDVVVQHLDQYPHKEHAIFSILTKQEIAQCVSLIIKSSIENAQEYCGFDDLMYLAAYDQAVVNELLRIHRGYKLVVFDESQDFNPARLNIALLFAGIINPEIRNRFNIRYPPDLETEDISNLPVITVLLDQNQGINGWNGAINNIAKYISQILIAEGILPQTVKINTSQRTPRAIEPLVHALGFSHFKSRKDAQKGEIAVVSIDTVWNLLNQLNRERRLGEVIITCRVNAAAYPIVYWSVKRGLPVTFRGKNIADELHRIIRRAQMEVGGDLRNNKTAIFNHLEQYFTSKIKNTRNPTTRENLDHVWVILSITGEDATSIPDWIARISTIARVVDEREDGSDIVERRNATVLPNRLTVSTIHRVKGDEAKYVITWRTDLMPHPLAQSPEEQESERRLIYVDATRVCQGSENDPWVSGGLKLYIDKYPGGLSW